VLPMNERDGVLFKVSNDPRITPQCPSPISNPCFFASKVNSFVKSILE
jgi:hypothetical protein